jgi:diguanylate cyclase (GGDEF)-like protein
VADVRPTDVTPDRRQPNGGPLDALLEAQAALGIAAVFLEGGRVVHANRVFLSRAGVSSTAIIGRAIELLFHPEDGPSVTGLLASSGETAELRLLHEGGEAWKARFSLRVYGEQQRRAVLVAEDRSGHLAAQAALEQRALYDGLTGLANRTLFDERLRSAMAAARADSPGSILVLDLDGFKAVNDGFGHQAGDELLREVANRLLRLTRASDVAARWGGDEFAILLPHTERNAAIVVGERIAAGLGAPFEVAGHEVEIGASIGLAVFPDDASEMEALLRVADNAMYAAKEAGGGRVTTGPGNEGMRAERLISAQELRAALTLRRLQLRYAAELRADGGVARCVGTLHWTHPRLGEVEADRIMSIARPAGLLPALRSWCLESASAEAAALTAVGIDVPIVFAIPAAFAREFPTSTQPRERADLLAPFFASSDDLPPLAAAPLGLAAFVDWVEERRGSDATAHAREYQRVLDLAEGFDRGRFGEAEGTPALADLVRDSPALTLALAWCLREGDAARALRLATSLRHFWVRTERAPEGLALLARALALPTARDMGLRALAQSAAAILALNEGELREANAFITRALESGAALTGDERFRLHNNAGLIATHLDDLPAARRHYESARVLAEELRAPGLIATVLSNLGTCAQREGRADDARAGYERALQIRASLPNRQAWALTRIYLAGLDYEEGHHGQALAGFRAALAVYMELGEASELALALEGVALLAASHEQPIAALQLAGAVTSIRARTRALPAPTSARPFADAIARASAAVTPAQRVAAILVGRALSRESAGAYALTLPLDLGT